MTHWETVAMLLCCYINPPTLTKGVASLFGLVTSLYPVFLDTHFSRLPGFRSRFFLNILDVFPSHIIPVNRTSFHPHPLENYSDTASAHHDVVKVLVLEMFILTLSPRSFIRWECADTFRSERAFLGQTPIGVAVSATYFERKHLLGNMK